MGLITETESFDGLCEVAGKIFDLDRSLPESVFRSNFKRFVFLDVDELFTDGFFLSMNTFVQKSSTPIWYFLMIDPDPKEYFANSQKYPALEITPRTPVSEYWVAFSEDSSPEAGDAIFYLGTSKILLFSRSCEWGILMDRNFEMGVAGFENPHTMSKFNEAFGYENLFSVQAAIDTFLVPAYGSLNSVPRNIQQKLLENYGDE
ncbi:MAG: hypothetical protein ACKVQW_09985 [Pyrinomonadaceae bacterium]